MTQNYNRYSYCLNNLLAYTDPNGEFIFTAFLDPLGAIIDAACWGEYTYDRNFSYTIQVVEQAGISPGTKYIPIFKLGQTIQH